MVANGTFTLRVWPEKTAFLGALCLFLSMIEYMVPKPLPFIRVGLANLPLIVALGMPFQAVAALAVLKVLGQAIVSGTLFSYVFLFSLCGTAASTAIMYTLRGLLKLRISCIGLSVCGAFFSNAAQIILARFLVLGKSVVYIAPALLAFAIVSGFALGVFCELFTEKSRWYRRFMAEDAYRMVSSPSIPAAGRKRKPRFLNACIVFVCIVLFHVWIPYGKVLFTIGTFPVTQGALLAGLRKACVLQGMVLFSRFAIRGTIQFPGFLGNLLTASFTVLRQFGEMRPLFSGRFKNQKNFIANLDGLLLGLFEARNTPRSFT
jgi:uncharacterized membrane protein